MRQTPERRQQVLDAANRLIAEQGLARFSMLALVQALGMSKETLYAWFGSKEGLLRELIHDNAGRAMEVLQAALEHPAGSEDELRRMLEAFCAQLLRLLMSERSVALNRGALHLGERAGFGRTLRSQGRDRALARLQAVLAQAQKTGLLRKDEKADGMAEVLAALALRDWQIERLLGRMGEPGAPRIRKRATEAARLFLRLYANS